MVSRSSLWFVTLLVSVKPMALVVHADRQYWRIQSVLSMVEVRAGSLKKKKKKRQPKEAPRNNNNKKHPQHYDTETYWHRHRHSHCDTNHNNKHHFETDDFLNWPDCSSVIHKRFLLKHCCSVSLQCSQAWRCRQWCHSGTYYVHVNKRVELAQWGIAL